MMEEPDERLQEREDEKLADLERLADAIDAFWQRQCELEQSERVHLARGLAAVISGCYGTGAVEAEIALAPPDARSPRAKLPADPFYLRCDSALFEPALNEVWEEPARRFPHFGRLDGS